MMDQPAVSNIFGTLGAVLWSIQLLPQIFLNWRRHNAAGLSPSFMLLWAFAGIPLGAYNIVSGFSIALQIQPQILITLSLLTWSQCQYYEQSWKWPKLIIVTIMAMIGVGGLEASFVFALRHGKENGTYWPLVLMAVLAATLLVSGVSEQYITIYRTRSVAGISFLFCAIDAAGDIASIISVAFGSKLDVAGLTIYAVEFLFWCGIFACGVHLKALPWIKERKLRMSTSGRSSEVTGSPDRQIQLHNLPSSTSVFHTGSTDLDLRQRNPPVLS
ncbi:PQ-loop-domain-containing protein [Myriangium duriaei CBS 260.36]|uniref:PQ-loop-domain-containing protein n=1 Tax=Myriangium duriaei CBS 260.36 TaxID=1168546 RepID=A0A9P4MGH2_9PEZI|nr:PQ-loop-domain-containing protein [Myriangium duriaei CBS 260.36]